MDKLAQFTANDLNEIESGGLPGFKFAGAAGTLGSIISSVIPIMFFIGGVLLLLYLLTGGFALMTSGGEPKKMAAAKQQITNALVGFFIVFTAFWIVQAIASFLGLPTVLNVFNNQLIAPPVPPGGGPS